MKHRYRFAKTFFLIGIVVALLYALHSGEEAAPGDLLPASKRGQLPDFSITDLNGVPWRLADHRGQVVLLNFWATWCPPCRQETPGLVRLANSYRRHGLEVIGISIDDGGRKAVDEFITQFSIPYPVALANDHLPLASSVQALPTTLLIDRRGRVAKAYQGGVSERTFRADVDELLNEKTDSD